MAMRMRVGRHDTVPRSRIVRSEINLARGLSLAHGVIIVILGFRTAFLGPLVLQAAPFLAVTALVLCAFVLSRIVELRLDAHIVLKGVPRGTRDGSPLLGVAFAEAAALTLIVSAVATLTTLPSRLAGLIDWPAAIGVLVAETVYVTWLYEGLAMKAELEAIATQVDSAPQKAAAAEPSADSTLALRASALLLRLRSYGLRRISLLEGQRLQLGAGVGRGTFLSGTGKTVWPAQPPPVARPSISLGPGIVGVPGASPPDAPPSHDESPPPAAPPGFSAEKGPPQIWVV